MCKEELKGFHCLGRGCREELEGLLFLCHCLIYWLGYMLVVLGNGLWPARHW
jgi:hypothetical protein